MCVFMRMASVILHACVVGFCPMPVWLFYLCYDETDIMGPIEWLCGLVGGVEAGLVVLARGGAVQPVPACVAFVVAQRA